MKHDLYVLFFSPTAIKVIRSRNFANIYNKNHV